MEEKIKIFHHGETESTEKSIDIKGQNLRIAENPEDAEKGIKM